MLRVGKYLFMSHYRSTSSQKKYFLQEASPNTFDPRRCNDRPAHPSSVVRVHHHTKDDKLCLLYCAFQLDFDTRQSTTHPSFQVMIFSVSSVS
jgi:hypothetical protein